MPLKVVDVLDPWNGQGTIVFSCLQQSTISTLNYHFVNLSCLKITSLCGRIEKINCVVRDSWLFSKKMLCCCKSPRYTSLSVCRVAFLVTIEVNGPIRSRPLINLGNRSRYQPTSQLLRRLVGNVRSSKVTRAIYEP